MSSAGRRGKALLLNPNMTSFSRPKTRVCHLTCGHSPFDMRIFHKECRTLVKAGFDLTLVVPHYQDEVVEGIRILAVPKPETRRERMTRTVWEVYRKAVAADAVLYHFHDPGLIPVGLLLALRGKRVIYDVHEDVPQQTLSKDWLPKGSRWFTSTAMSAIENWASGHFAGLVTATPTIAQRFKRRGIPLALVQNFSLVDEKVLSRSGLSSDREMAAIYLGGISRIRGIREMIEAIEIVQKEVKARLLLAGEFESQALREEMERLPGWKAVEYLGQIDPKEVGKVMARARLGLVLFHPEPNHIYAQPNKLFEYMSFGLPVIASDFTLWQEIVGRTGAGLLVNPLDPKAIATAIVFLLKHPEEGNAIGSRGRQAVEEHYNWAIEERKLLSLYESILR